MCIQWADKDMLEKLDKIFFINQASLCSTINSILRWVLSHVLLSLKSNVSCIYTPQCCSTFFFTQWQQSTQGYFVQQVKAEMNDFDLNCDLGLIASNFKNSFKTLVKNKANKYVLKVLTERKSSLWENRKIKLYSFKNSKIFS